LACIVELLAATSNDERNVSSRSCRIPSALAFTTRGRVFLSELACARNRIQTSKFLNMPEHTEANNQPERSKQAKKQEGQAGSSKYR
jgi:hypothetical protein